MFKHLSQIIAADSDFIAILLILLIAVIIFMVIKNSFQRKRLLKLSPNKPGDVLDFEDGDHIVVSPLATLVDLKTAEEFKVFQILDRIWDNVGKQLFAFYAKPFEISLKISNLTKESDGYSIIVSDKNENLYKLKTKHLPENYTVKLHVSNSFNGNSETEEASE